MGNKGKLAYPKEKLNGVLKMLHAVGTGMSQSPLALAAACLKRTRPVG